MEEYKKRIAESFDNKSSSYDKYSVVQQEVANRLMDRIKYLKCNPSNILDIGSGTGYLTKNLQSYFPKANIFCLDISEKMSIQCKSKNPKSHIICGDAELLPLKPSSIDLVISSFTFQWCKDLERIFSDVKRLLTDNGIFIFSTVGPDTLIELKNIFKNIDNEQHVNNFLDMHIFGDLLLALNFFDPVMDVERLTIKYKSFGGLLKALRCTGSNIVISDDKQPSEVKTISKMKQVYKEIAKNDFFSVTYEVIYAIAWNRNIKSPIKNKKIVEIKKA